jgi:hypothetical protein
MFSLYLYHFQTTRHSNTGFFWAPGRGGGGGGEGKGGESTSYDPQNTVFVFLLLVSHGLHF